MQLTRHTDYALRVLMLLGSAPPATTLTIDQMARQLSVSGNHLRKVVHTLGRRGYVQTMRGVGGGIRLAQQLEAVGLGAVVRDMEATLELVNCERPLCPLHPACGLKGILDEARDAFLAALDRYTLADLVRQPERLEAILVRAG